MNQDVAREVLSRVMEPGRRYTVGGLQRLFEEYYDEWEDEDFSPIKGVGNVWRVAVKNSVRMSPDRPDYGDNSWSELRGEKSGRNYEYWIGIESPVDLESLLRPFGRKRPVPNDGWNAERYVMSDLRRMGFSVIDVSGGGFGCDLIAKKNDRTLRVEVKSSVGPCSPTMTDGEWREALRFRENYVLAILDFFDPEESEEGRVFYLVDPASLESRGVVKHRTTTNHVIGREGWIKERGALYEDLGYHVPRCYHDCDSDFTVSFGKDEWVVFMECCGTKWVGHNIGWEAPDEESYNIDHEWCVGRECVPYLQYFEDEHLHIHCKNCEAFLSLGWTYNAWWTRFTGT